jgi:multidrug efflux pump subunit AcrB
MNLASFSVKNSQLMLVLFAMAIALGVNTLFTMPRSEDPEMEAPLYPILAIYPGTSPQDMEQLVVNPIEERVMQLEDIKKVTSVVGDGVAFLQVDFKFGVDVDEKYSELVREVNAIRDELPEDLMSLEVKKVSPTDVNVIQAAFISENASFASIKTQAERLKERLEKVKSLKNIKYYGLPDEVVKVDLRLDRLAQLHIPLNAILGAIQSESANIPGGSVQAGSKTFNVKTSGNYASLDEIANTVVWTANGKIVYLKDVAEISQGFEENRHIARLNGHRCVFFVAAQKPGENITRTQAAYLPILDEFKKQLPSNIDLVTHFDQAENVSKRLGSLGFDFMLAILLVAITLLPLGGRAALVVMISIPLSLAIGLVMLDVMGFTLNQLSIVGLVVALGLLVDDSIVVVENIERWLRDGFTRRQAAIEATKQITLAVVGCTATLIIAFMPLVFMPEASGDFIRGLPMAVISAVLASMVVSLTIIPFLGSVILRSHHNPEGNLFMRLLKRVISGSYARVLEGALHRPWLSLAVSALIFAGALSLFPVIGFSLFPASEKPQFIVNVTMPLQSNIEATNALTQRVEKVLAADPKIMYYATNVGHGNPRIYYNVIPANERPDFAEIFVQLDPHTLPDEKRQVIERLRGQFAAFPGAKIEVKDFEQGPPIEAPIAVRLFGDNLDTLRTMAGRVESMLQNVPGTIYVNNPVKTVKSDLRVRINKDKARMLGIQTADIDRTVRLAIAGLDMGTYTDAKGDEYDIVVSSPKQGPARLDIFDELYVNSMTSAAIPLRQVADIALESSPSAINHLDKSRFVTVTAFVQKGYLVNDLITATQNKMDAMQMPAGFRYQMAGEVESRQESFGGFGAVILVTVFLFVGVLILLFKTFKSTLIVLSVIPLGIIGAVTALWITGNSLSFVAIIGLIALAGIEVKNSILLVDFTNQLRAQGKGLEAAIREAGEIRFLPIVLTSLTAIGGLVPIALTNNPLIAPLAIVLIGGLISSTLLSRIVTPVVYQLIPPKVELDPDFVPTDGDGAAQGAARELAHA